MDLDLRNSPADQSLLMLNAFEPLMVSLKCEDGMWEELRRRMQWNANDL